MWVASLGLTFATTAQVRDAQRPCSQAPVPRGSRRGEPPTSTRFSSRRYSMTSCCWRVIHPASAATRSWIATLFMRPNYADGAAVGSTDTFSTPLGRILETA